MLWPGKFVRLPNKKTTLTVLVTVSLFLYSILSNKCLVNRVHSVFRAVDFIGQNASSEFELNSTHLDHIKPQPLVRLIPLINWEGNEQVEAIFNSTESKYLLLGKLGKPLRRLPDALIIGVKKAGTRALLDFIKLHPDVRAAKPEVHFFSRNYQRGLNWYREQMPPSLEGQITMEKSPSYFVTKDVPYRVWRMNRKTKLLVIVRDPVTRAVSDFTQGVSKKKSIEARSFESLAFVKDSGFRVVDTTWGPVRTGLYSRHLNRWLKFFPLDQMLFVSGERLIADPAAEMARVQDFLGLKRVITEKHFFFNSTKGFPCLMKAEGSSSPHCLGKTKGRKHVFVPHKALDRLRDFYRPFNLKFYQMTGINFGWP